MVGYVLTKLTRPITRLLERDLRRREEKKGELGKLTKGGLAYACVKGGGGGGGSCCVLEERWGVGGKVGALMA